MPAQYFKNLNNFAKIYVNTTKDLNGVKSLLTKFKTIVFTPVVAFLGGSIDENRSLSQEDLEALCTEEVVKKMVSISLKSFA